MLTRTVKVAFGLAFDVEKASRQSGFKPARFDLGAGKELFGDLRLDGFAALLRIGFAEKLVVVGGNEGRYKDEEPVINRAAAIRDMLIYDKVVESNRVSSIVSNSNTGGNITAIARQMEQMKLGVNDCAVVSNLYHLPRVFLDLTTANLWMPIYPAEAFWLLQREGHKDELIKRLGGGSLAERVAEEAQGIAHKLHGTYKPRTDTSVTK